MFNETNREGSRKCKKDKQVNVLDEQEKAGEDAEKDIRELSNALCPEASTSSLTKFGTIGTEVESVHRPGRHREAPNHADHAEEATNSECCRRVLDPEVSDESTHAVQNHQQQRDRLNEN